ncbi:MAG: polyribonucleotide nucleotidyltransferase [Rhodothermaceae bacterium]|nr:MAG: polyribonucleotide nucleotidyltransferase [Rhodothermaceae bacterium]
MSKTTIREIEFAPGRTITLETGRLAKQANGSVVARLGDTMVLCTAVIAKDVREGQGFFPLTVDYREKYSAGGKIPGGFIKREGRPTDKEVLSSRLVDRALRPLFAEGFYHEVQVIIYVISADPENDADVLAGIGASAALMLAGAPFDGPIAEVRVGRVNGEYIVNPTIQQLEESDIDLIVAGKEDALVMVEGEMEEISEEEMVEALDVAHEAIKVLCRGQRDFVAEHGPVEPFAYEPIVTPPALVERVRELLGPRMAEHLRAPYDKASFYDGIDAIKEEVLTALLGQDDPEAGTTRADATPEGWTAGQIKDAVSQVEKEVMREMILSEHRRLDGRRLDEIRDIWAEVGYLPRVHGSAIFTRGETQVLASVTLGTKKDVQAVDQIFDTTDRRFYLHYNFPPFCTGEVKFLRGASRREIGHGFLAERALAPMLPSEEEFPYTIRVNADVLESNGSSSMASVCSGSLALMDAGVPIKKAVAGIAMGLISDGQRTAVLSDILGTEDHLGDMDFKVTGTRDGITACQMDIKIAGLSREILLQALEQARAGRHHILDIMDSVLDRPRPNLSPYAPRLTQITIDASFIGAVIGPGGKVIQGIQRDTNTTIDITEEGGIGIVTVAATNEENARAAIEMIKAIVTVPEAGETYVGTVRKIEPFGAIIEILPGKEGLLHVSELDYGYVERVEDHLQVGDKVQVQLIEVRDDGKLRFSRKPFLPKPEGYDESRESRNGGRGGRDGGRGGRDGGRGGRGGRDGGRGGRDRRGGRR